MDIVEAVKENNIELLKFKCQICEYACLFTTDKIFKETGKYDGCSDMTCNVIQKTFDEFGGVQCFRVWGDTGASAIRRKYKGSQKVPKQQKGENDQVQDVVATVIGSCELSPRN